MTPRSSRLANKYYCYVPIFRCPITLLSRRRTTIKDAYMSVTKLRTAVLGLNDQGQNMLAAACETGLFDIVSVADSDQELAEKIAQRHQCSFFDDYRQLVIQNQLDVIIVSAPMHLCAEYLRMAMKKKFNIIKLSPPALDFEQAVDLFAIADKQGVKFTAANVSRFSPGFSRLRDYLQSHGSQEFYLITVQCHIPEATNEPDRRWLSDPQLAGGGVLLRSCYEIIDQIVLHFGIPQLVYSVNTNYAPDKQQRVSTTEDTALVTMKFSDVLMANIIATRTFGPARIQLQLHAKEKYLTVTPDSFTVCDNFSKVLDDFKDVAEDKVSMAKMLEDFAQSMLCRSEKAVFASETADLHNMAVIESAYLSARTAMPEAPGRILEMANAEMRNVLMSAAKKNV